MRGGSVMKENPCANCPTRKDDYCGNYDTFLDPTPAGYEPCYLCGNEIDME